MVVFSLIAWESQLSWPKMLLNYLESLHQSILVQMLGILILESAHIE
jgi:hypothetical protein